MLVEARQRPPMMHESYHVNVLGDRFAPVTAPAGPVQVKSHDFH